MQVVLITRFGEHDPVGVYDVDDLDKILEFFDDQDDVMVSIMDVERW